MNNALTIREANFEDIQRLLDLYIHLTPNNEPYSIDIAEDVFARFSKYEGSAILLGEIGDKLVSSCTLVIVPNLTRGGRSFALVENVVTHVDHRCQGFGKSVLDAATNQAWENDCYKIMLLTGSNERSTLAFYEKSGFMQSKTGFQKRRAVTTK